MHEKEIKSDFYIAAEHWFNTTWITAVLGLIVFGTLYYYSIIDMDTLDKLEWWQILINPAFVWVGTKFSASLINKWYDFSNGNHIALLSTIYAVVVALLFSSVGILFSGHITFSVTNFASILCAIVFYLESCHSLKNEGENY